MDMERRSDWTPRLAGFGRPNWTAAEQQRQKDDEAGPGNITA
jgi:hypothetical protein